MIINNWYAASFADELTDTPKLVRMLGCDFALFRTEDGAAACLSNICCHRGGSLAHGQRVGNCIQCPYHGWQYAADGFVQQIPPLGDAVAIPRRARVDSYPVQEKYGLLWVFLGDMNEQERPVLSDSLSVYGDTENWRMCRLQREWNVNWVRLNENLVDTAHLYLVHSFGKHLPSKMNIFPVEVTEWGGHILQTFRPPDPKDSMAIDKVKQQPDERQESHVELTYDLIGILHKNSQQMASGYNQIIWDVCTPIDAYHTRHFSLHFRNFNKSPEHDEGMVKALRYGLDEDAAVVEHVRPRLTPARQNMDLFVATDDAELSYRRKVDEVGRRLGRIDVHRMDELTPDQALVIPSPARAEGGNWGHASVPLLDS